MADELELPIGAALELRERARRILPQLDGPIATLGDRLGPQVITNELLMMAQDAIACVAGEAQPMPSGKAQLRLLTVLVADAMHGCARFV